MKKLLLVLLLCFNYLFLEAQCVSGAQEISHNQTTPSGQRGQMFDVVAQNNITIHCFAPRLYVDQGTYMIYYRYGSHVGHDNSAVGWTFVDSVQGISGVANSLTLIPIDVNIPVLAGDTVAFYITARGPSPSYGGMFYLQPASFVSVGTVWKSDPNLKILTGVGKAYPFSTVFNPRQYIGTIYYTGGVLLPLNFISFKAEKKTNFHLLKWTTENEVNTSYFEIEKSEDGNTFATIGKVEAAGNHNGQLTYEFLDRSFATKRSYYRLTCYDLDGKQNRSEIISIYTEEINEIRVFPNPFSEEINIQVDDYNQSFMLYDAYGKLLQLKDYVPQQIDLSHFSSGIYFLKIGNKSLQIVKV